MTQYKNVNVNISEGQLQKLKHSINANCAATSIRLGYDDLEGNHMIALTNAQFNKLQKAKEQGKGITIRMSSKQLKHNIKTEGGFFGAVLPALAGIGRAVAPMLLNIGKKILPGLATGIFSELGSAGTKKILGNGLYLKRGG